MNLKEVFKISSLPILFASLCCLAPIILVAFGISTVAFAASLTNLLDGKYKWVFLLVGFATLGFSLVRYFRRQGICTIDQVAKHRQEIINKTLLVLIAVVIGYILFFNIFLGLIGKALGIWQNISFKP